MRPANLHALREPRARSPDRERRRDAHRRSRQPQRRLRQLGPRRSPAAAARRPGHDRRNAVSLRRIDGTLTRRDARTRRARRPARRAWQREVAIAASLLAFGLLVLPFAIYFVGQQTARRVRRRMPAPSHLAESIWLDLLSLRLPAWILVLSPYLTFSSYVACVAFGDASCDCRHRFRTRRRSAAGASAIVFPERGHARVAAYLA